MNPNAVQPIFILPENTQRTSGKTAQRNNILAAKAVADSVRTTLGPKGMDKMLVDAVGEVIVTNDGVTILDEMHVEHPAAKMIVAIAKTQEDEVGDGTTSAVILAGELLANAELLLDQKIHPTVIIRGYQAAQQYALDELRKLTIPISAKDTNQLQQLAETAMTGKGAEVAKEQLARLTVDAVLAVQTDKNVDLDAIKIEKKVGTSIQQSQLIEGVVLDKERVHPSMPTEVKQAKIVLINSSIEVQETEIDAKISITDPTQMQAFLDMEEKMLTQLTNHIQQVGATVVLCQKGIDELAAYEFAKKGILAVRRVKKSDMEKISRATGAQIVTKIRDVSDKDVGFAGLVAQKKVGDEQMIFIEQCSGPKAVTILLRAGTEHVVSEVERAVTDAVGDLKSAIQSGAVVAGAGAIEMALARRVQDFANGLSGREQLAVQAFADALQVIPRTLAENAGLDPIDVLADLKAVHVETSTAGINVFTGKVMDAQAQGVIEPQHIKLQAISSATDVATMILRIDDVIAAGPAPQMSPEQMQ